MPTLVQFPVEVIIDDTSDEIKAIFTDEVPAMILRTTTMKTDMIQMMTRRVA
jgi:hypothetical protein